MTITHPNTGTVDRLLEEVPRMLADGIYEGSPRGTEKAKYLAFP